MEKRTVKLTLFFLFNVLFAVPALADLNERATSLLEKIKEDTSAPSLSVAVSYNGKVVVATAVGWANKSAKTAATVRTQYRTGSVSKVIGTTAFMKLVEQKKVNLSDGIHDYLPYLPAHYESITLNHLLTHTSGIRHYNFGEYGTNIHYPTLEKATRVFRDSPLEFSPGKNYRYTTYGINLIQGVIEETSKLPLKDYMQVILFSPLGLDDTELEIKGEENASYATGYRTYLSNMAVKEIDVSNKYIGGGMRTTPTDLVNLVSAIEFGAFLNSQTKAAMLSTPFPDVAPNRMLGWRKIDYKGKAGYGHGGAINGFESYLVHFIDDGLTVALMVNEDGYDHTTSTLYEIYELVLGSVKAE